MKRFLQISPGHLRVSRILLILAAAALASGRAGAQALPANQLPNLPDFTIHTDIPGQQFELPGSPFFPIMSFTLTSNRQDDWSDPLLQGVSVTITEFGGPPIPPPGTPLIPIGAISCVAVGVDNPVAGIRGEFDARDTIIERAFLHLDVADPANGATATRPIEAATDQIGWMHNLKLGTLTLNIAGSRFAWWATNPNVGLDIYANDPNAATPGLGLGVYPQWINNASLAEIDFFSDLPLGSQQPYIDIIPTAAANFGQPRRYFILLALTELLPDNAQMQVRLNNLTILPSLDPVPPDAANTNNLGRNAFINSLQLNPAVLSTAAAVLASDGGHFTVVANVGDGFFPGEVLNANGIPQFVNPTNLANPGGPLPDSGPGYYPPFNPALGDLAHRGRIVIGPHQTPILHTAENPLQVLSLELAANQVVGAQVYFGGFGLLFKKLGEYREILGDGIDNDGDSWMLQHNGLDDNLNGEDNDGNPATPNWADGVDNNGDGQTDEDIDDPMEGVDETFRLTERGFNGMDDTPPVDGVIQAELDDNGNPVKDGKDNDGDGLIDEGIDELEEAIGMDPVELAGRNDDKDYVTSEGLSIVETPLAYENGLDDDGDTAIDNMAEGVGPVVGILRYQANIFYNDDGSDSFYSDRAPTGESIINYVSRTFLHSIELGQNPDYQPFAQWVTGPNGRLLAGLGEVGGFIFPVPVIYPAQIIGFDNDFDNLYDEDPRDGMDNDGDGLIDEDVTWCPLMPSVDEETLDYFVDGFSVFGGNRRGMFDEGSDEYYIDFDMDGVFDQGAGDADGTRVSEYRGGGRGFPSLHNGESYFQLGIVYPLDNDGDGEDNDFDPSTPAVANGVDDDFDGFTDEGFNEDVNDFRSEPSFFLNFDGAVPPVEVFRDNRTPGVVGSVVGALDPTDARMEIAAAPDPFNPMYVGVTFAGDPALFLLPQTDDANFDFFVTIWSDSMDGAPDTDLLGNWGLRYGDDFMIQSMPPDVSLGAKWSSFNYDVGLFDTIYNALSPDYWTDNTDAGNIPQGEYPAGRLNFRLLTKRHVGRLLLEDMEGEARSLGQDPNSPLGGALGSVIFENGFRTPSEPVFQFLAADLAGPSNMSGPPDAFPERQFPVWYAKKGFPLLEPDGLSQKPLIGIDVTDASEAVNGDVGLESIDQIRINFANVPYPFGRGHFEPSDLNPLRSVQPGETGSLPSGLAIYMDRYNSSRGNADDDGDAEDNDNNPNTPAVRDNIDNDGDGLTDEGWNEDDLDFVDNDGDGLTDEDPPFYANLPNSVFDPGDVPVPINLTNSAWDIDPNDPVVRGGGHYVVLTPQVGMPIPPDDSRPAAGSTVASLVTRDPNYGYDYFITVTGSQTMDDYDGFIAYIRPGDILFSNGRNLPGGTIQTTPVRSTPPNRIAATANSGALTRSSRSIPVLALNTQDGNDNFDPRFVYNAPLGRPGPQRLWAFWLIFHENLDQTIIPPFRRFTPSDLAPLQNLLVPSPNTGRLMSLSGIAIYRDVPGSDTNGGFDDPDDPNVAVPDTPVLLSGDEAFGLLDGRPGALQFELDPPLWNGNKDVSTIDPNDPDPYEPLPPNDVGENEGADFFVVLRTSNTISAGDSFYVTLGNVHFGNSGTGVPLVYSAFDYFPPHAHHMLDPGDSLLTTNRDISTIEGTSNQLINAQPFDSAPIMVFQQPKFLPNQTVPTRISSSYTLVWVDGDDELDNDPDANTFPEVNLYYAPASNLSARVLINRLGPINGSLDGVNDQFLWDVRTVPPGVYRVLGTIDDKVNPIELAQGGLVEVVNSPPDIQMTAPVGINSVAGGVISVFWTDGDPENNAVISLYIVPAGGSASGATDGILLATGIPEDPDGAGDRYDVDLDPLLLAGVIERGQTYFFLAGIDDNVAGPQRPKFSRSPGTVTIKNVPTVRIVNPGSPPLQDLLLYYDITWTDRVPPGHGATLELFFSVSNFGYSNNVAVTQPVAVPAVNRIVTIANVQDRTGKVYRWEVSDGTRLFPNRPSPGDYFIFARITDDESNATGNFSAGRLRVSDHAVQVLTLFDAPQYALDRFTIRWAGVSEDPSAKLAIYYDDDNSGFNGRLVGRAPLDQESTVWQLYRNSDPTQRNVPVGSFYLYFELEDNITNAGGRYRFYSPYGLSVGVPAVESPKMLLSDGRAMDPNQADTFIASKSLLDGVAQGTPHALRAVGSPPEHPGLYVLDESGAIYAVGKAEAMPGPDLLGDGAVDLEHSPLGGYYLLDSHGAIHELAGAAPLSGLFLADGTARDLELTPDGRGAYVLDGYGGIHRVGKTSLPFSFNLGADIARDVELTPDGKGMYVLDGYGGIHVAGTARRFSGPIFGSDIATDLWVDPSGNGYYILDKFGGIHTCGQIPQLPSLRLSTPSARDLFQEELGALGMFWTRSLEVAVDPDSPLDPMPDTDGEWVAWVDSQPGRPTGADIAYSRVGDTTTRLLPVPGDQSDPGVNHGVLVYTSREDLDDDIIMAPDMDLASIRYNLSRNFNVANGTQGTDNQRQPDVDVREVATGNGTMALGAVTWSAYDSRNREWDVYLQLIARDFRGLFAPVPGAILEISEGTNGSDQRDPAVVITDLRDNHGTVMVVYSDNRSGNMDLVYALVQVRGTGLSTYAIEGGVLVRDLVRRSGAQVDPRVTGGNVIFTDESAGGDIYAVRMSLADPRNPVPAGPEIAVATSDARQFAGRVTGGDAMAWIDRYNSFFDVVVSDPRIAVFGKTFPGMLRPQTLGLVSPLNGFAEVFNLEYSDDPVQPVKWLVWSEKREGKRRVVLYEQSVRPASAE